MILRISLIIIIILGAFSQERSIDYFSKLFRVEEKFVPLLICNSHKLYNT